MCYFQAMAVTMRQIKGVIFDLDGVLVDSSLAVNPAWAAWGLECGIDRVTIAAGTRGRRTRDAVSVLAPHLDPDIETEKIIALEQGLADRVVPIPGAAELLSQLPSGRWGIGTSGTAAIAYPRLRYAALPIPHVLITAEMVARGKPDPQVYLRAAADLGFDPSDCVVFEDAPDGIVAATRAGCLTVGVLTWAGRDQLATPLAIQDLRSVRATPSSDQITLHIELPE
jgi:sugar-phosphatase